MDRGPDGSCSAVAAGSVSFGGAPAFGKGYVARRPSAAVDATDIAIMREVFRERVFFWGNLDPRLSLETIARRVGLARTTVRARIQRWSKDGFIERYEVMPNPSLFGARLGACGVRIEDPRAKARFLDELDLVDGVVVALDHLGPWVVVDLVIDEPRLLERRRRLMARLPGVNEVEECLPIETPRATADLTDLDWRIVKALREAPLATIDATARKVGVSAKTLARRYERLVASNAVWFVPVLDFGGYTGGSVGRLIVTLAKDADPRKVAKGLRALPGALVVADLHPVHPGPVPGPFDVLCHLDAVPHAEAVQRAALDVTGVAGVEVIFPRSLRVYNGWFEAQMGKLDGASPRR